MDNNNLRLSLPNGEPAMDTGDWRAQLSPDSRHKIVNKIMETLKKHLPSSGPEGINELRRIAARFEEKNYRDAVDQTDYLRKITMKMLTMETISQNAAGSSSSIPAANNGTSMDSRSLPTNQSQAPQPLMSQTMQNNTAYGMTGSTVPSSMPPVSSLTNNNVTGVVNQNLNMQSVAGMLQDSSGQHGLSSNMFSGSQRQMLGRPHGEPAVNTGDWRTQLPPDSRQRNAYKIMETLEKHVPNLGLQGINELLRIAVSFEDLIFKNAINQVDYVSKISFRMLSC